MRLVIFEDDQFDRFMPLAWLRGVFELRSGATTLCQKIERSVGTAVDVLLVRDYLAQTVGRRNASAAINDLSCCREEDVLFVNARVCASHWVPPEDHAALWHGERLAVWRTTEDVAAIGGYAGLAAAAREADRTEFSGKWFDYIWDVMLASPEEIRVDFEAMGRRGNEGNLHETSVILGSKEDVYIGPGAQIHPFVCIDARHGPITIESDCEVHPFTRIEGPCYVGSGSVLLGAKVREGCSIGPRCRVGGEIEESIIHGHSNKYHDGFLGHAYVGEWVNLGALTTNSDLKNDYSPVSVVMGGDPVNTGSTKVGSFIGDHVKTSIGVLLNTGSSVGTMAVLVAAGTIVPKYIPSYAWFLGGVVSKGFGLDPLIDTARTAMSRRKVEMTDADEQLLRHVFELTEQDRQAQVHRSRRAMAAR